MRLICTCFSKPTMDLHLENYIQFQGAASIDYSVLLFVTVFDIEDYIKIDVGVCIDILKC